MCRGQPSRPWWWVVESQLTLSERDPDQGPSLARSWERLCLLVHRPVCSTPQSPDPATFAGLTPFRHKDSAGGCVDAVAGGPAHFECETAEDHVPVRWFKDGTELDRSCLRFSQEDMGTRHRLVATSVTRVDEGTYSCRVGEHSVDFRLHVSGEHVPAGLGGCRSGPIQHLQDQVTWPVIYSANAGDVAVASICEKKLPTKH